MPTMIYHVPFPLQPNAATASQIRPVKMREAFEAAGYNVIEISGYANERRRRIRQVERQVRQGLVVDFAYSEAATIPTSFTEPRHLPLHLFLDRNFFKFLHRFDVPIGVFYRDVYWAFPDYVASVGRPVAAVMRKLYQWDIDTYNRYVKVLFLPSTEMAPYVDGLKWPQPQPLPPGCPAAIQPTKSALTLPLNLLYVGNIGGDHYRVTSLLEAVHNNTNVSLTIVTRETDWEKAKTQYRDLIGNNITVVHAAPNQLDKHYRTADIAMMFVEPQEYRDFAVPFKLFEYLGRGKPVIASSGTMAGDIVERSGAGWTIPYSTESLEQLLGQLMTDLDLIPKASSNAQKVGVENSWENRAREVAAILTRT